MPSTRNLMRKPAVRNALSWIAARYIRLVWITGRWEVRNSASVAGLIADGTPVIACFWHGRMLMMANMWPYDRPMAVLISRHRDGQFISRTLEWLRIGTISGSSSRGGGNALVAMVHALRDGTCIAITPDGPRGPRMRVAPGAAIAAKLSGAVLLPVSYSARWRIVSGSWDRMLVPLPFTRGIVAIGEPIRVLRDADDDETARIRQTLETELNALSDALDAELGVDRIAPEGEAEAGGLQPAEGLK